MQVGDICQLHKIITEQNVLYRNKDMAELTSRRDRPFKSPDPGKSCLKQRVEDKDIEIRIPGNVNMKK